MSISALKITSFLNSLQVFFATKRLIFINLFTMFEVGLIISWFVLFQIASKNFSDFAPTTYKIGELTAILAFVVYILTLIPGIIRRWQILPQFTNPIATILMLFRRHLGISMFLLAFVHQNFSRVLPIVAQYGFGPKLFEASLPEMAGSLSLLILLPLWLTSNDLSMKKLGKAWKKLHALTYLALFFIFLHVLLQSSKWAVPGLVFLVLEISSWLVYWKRKKSRFIQ